MAKAPVAETDGEAVVEVGVVVVELKPDVVLAVVDPAELLR